jgi:type VI secretion system protein ImpM
MEVGFYGKLPTHGDFLRRRVPDSFVEPWDAWLRDCLASSRSALGDRWLDVYLTSPAWRFVCAPGVCGPDAMLGLMAPSVDRVGRYFPLTLVSELPQHANLLNAATASALFMDNAERLVIDTLAAELVDFDSFDQRVLALGQELGTVTRPPTVVLDPAAVTFFNNDARAAHISIGSAGQLATMFEQLLSMRLATTYEPLMLWWTEGSNMVDPSCLITKGLPDAAAFAAMLDGSWTTHHWTSIPTHIEADQDDDTLSDYAIPLRFRSAAATHVGRVRGNNEDGFVERLEIGLWAVADGLGGHRDGETASRMVCDALADFEARASFDDTVEAARQRIKEVNEHLVHASGRSPQVERCGSTVVVLLTRGARLAVLWAGDSRAYRWRGGRLEQLSHDHSLPDVSGSGNREEAHVVTRAVGIEPAFNLDVYRDTVSPDDRFLLCSDGLTRVVQESQIATLMQNEDIAASVEQLIKATLDGGAPDNVTVLAVEAYATPAETLLTSLHGATPR